jgi:hypothetical protein
VFLLRFVIFDNLKELFFKLNIHQAIRIIETLWCFEVCFLNLIWAIQTAQTSVWAYRYYTRLYMFWPRFWHSIGILILARCNVHGLNIFPNIMTALIIAANYVTTISCYNKYGWQLFFHIFKKIEIFQKLWPPKISCSTGNQLGILESDRTVYFTKAVKYDESQQKRIRGLPKTQLSWYDSGLYTNMLFRSCWKWEKFSEADFIFKNALA